MTPQRKPSSLAPIVAACAILGVPLAAYVTGYFWLGERTDWYGMVPVHNKPIDPENLPGMIIRLYPQRWMMVIYRPASWLEGRFVGTRVHAGCPDEYFPLPDDD